MYKRQALGAGSRLLLTLLQLAKPSDEGNNRKAKFNSAAAHQQQPSSTTLLHCSHRTAPLPFLSILPLQHIGEAKCCTTTTFWERGASLCYRPFFLQVSIRNRLGAQVSKCGNFSKCYVVNRRQALFLVLPTNTFLGVDERFSKLFRNSSKCYLLTWSTNTFFHNDRQTLILHHIRKND